MKSIAIITARGGSKRIPKKNIKEFMGKPMIAYAIEVALYSEIFDEVMVSTDDIEIATIAQIHGAQVPFLRSKKTADDFATTFDVLDEVIQEYKKLNLLFDTFACIYPCVPLLSPTTLKKAYKQFHNFDALVPVCKYPSPIEWAMKIENDLLIPNNRELQNIRSQDIIEKYFDVGMFYFCRTNALYQNNSLIPNNTTAYIMPEYECQDIDTFDDWSMAEYKYMLMQKKDAQCFSQKDKK